MEETKSLLCQGCELAKDLESTFPHNLSSNSNRTHPNAKNSDIIMVNRAINTCEEIIRKFGRVIKNLESHLKNPLFDYHPQYLEGPSSSSLRSLQIGTKSENCINMAVGTEMVLAPYGHEPEKAMNGNLDAHVEGKGGEGQWLLEDLSTQRAKRRRENTDKRVIQVPESEYGNTEIPPDDGHTWRKYGQKVILGSKFPRSYYRCTHQKYCNCPAKKQVKKLDDDPTKFEVIYIGQHTCHKSPTAPISLPILSPQPPSFTHCRNHHHIGPHIIPSQAPPNTWHYMAFNIGDGENGNISNNTSESGPGASATQHDMEREYTIANMANGMFNSSSGHTNNVDWIFQAAKGKDLNKKN